MPTPDRMVLPLHWPLHWPDALAAWLARRMRPAVDDLRQLDAHARRDIGLPDLALEEGGAKLRNYAP